MSAEEHATLSLGLAHYHSLRIMVSVVRHVLSTGSHELGSSPPGHPCRACTAQTQVAARARQSQRSRKLTDSWLWQSIQTQLTQGYLPEQITGRLRRTDPDDMRKHLSLKTI